MINGILVRSYECSCWPIRLSLDFSTCYVDRYTVSRWVRDLTSMSETLPLSCLDIHDRRIQTSEEAVSLGCIHQDVGVCQ
jgi:hypothetical protein